MNWEILEAYVTTLIEMINTGDHNCWDAIKKYRAFSQDIQKEFEIVRKEKIKNEN